MPSHDLLQPGLGLPDRVLDRAKFFKESRELLKAILAREEESESTRHSSREIQDLIRRYVRLYRAAIVALACVEDFSAIEHVVAAYNVHSDRILALGTRPTVGEPNASRSQENTQEEHAGLTLGELNILQVHGDSQEELEEKYREIRKMQKEITRRPTVKLTDYRAREKPKEVRQKHDRAAFFQGTGGMADFYHKRYDS